MSIGIDVGVNAGVNVGSSGGHLIYAEPTLFTHYAEAKATPALNLTDEGIGAYNAAVAMGLPCSIETALVHADADDTVGFFDNANYDMGDAHPATDSDLGALYPRKNGSLGSPITFMAYTGDSPYLTGSYIHPLGYIAYCLLSTGGASYITFDGFTLEHSINYSCQLKMGAGNTSNDVGCILQNNTVIGGSMGFAGAGGNDNDDLISVKGPNSGIIRNNTIYSLWGGGTGNNDNWSGIKLYHVSYMEIYNNTIYNIPCAISSKSQTSYTNIYNNWFDDNWEGFHANIYLDITFDNNHIYNNLITNFKYYGILLDGNPDAEIGCPDCSVYNNTLYTGSEDIDGLGLGGCGAGTVLAFNFYNNIIQAPNQFRSYSFPFSTGYASETALSSTIESCDHNQFGTGVFKIHINRYGGPEYTSLAAWQASGELLANYDAGCGLNQNPGCGSLVSDPLFKNTSGNLNEIADFELETFSPCYETGRGGANMGCNISTVGVQ